LLTAWANLAAFKCPLVSSVSSPLLEIGNSWFDIGQLIEIPEP